jgi:ATP phosphoribosyltransferase regulatory subunit HisZ
MGLPAAGAFEDLGPFVLCDHALELGEQGILGAVTAGALEKYHVRARLRELLDQQRLVGVLTGQPVRGIDQQPPPRCR